jgi:hypothetical protein
MVDLTTQVDSDKTTALECYEGEAAFKAKLAVIARQKPVPKSTLPQGDE